MSFIDDLRAIGGTNIFEAIEIALKNRGKDVPPRMIILITDGKPTIGLTNEKELIREIKKKNTYGIRIFTFGIGNDINTHLLDKLTLITGAFRSYINPNEDIEVKISNFFTKIESPVLTDLELKIDSPLKVGKVYPRDIPDLFKGSSISLIGRFSGSGNAKIILKGKIMKRSKKFVFSGNFKKTDHSSDFIPKLWAARKVGFLLDQIRLNGENDELKNEIIRVARKYGIVTPYTSYLIVEDEKRSVSRRLIRERDRLLTPSVFAGSKFKEEAARNHSSLQMKSGSLSVRASREVQQMYLASDYSQINQGIKRIPLKNIGVKSVGIHSVVQNINGRAFYNTGNFWVDSLIRVRKNLRTEKIKFLSDKYFKLLKNYPFVSKFLFLGKNVKFVYNSIIYEISE
jgi:Ca-activated chloride channel family protein